MLYILTAHTSARLEYTMAFVFEEVLGIAYKIINDPSAAEVNGVIIQYGTANGGISIPNSGLLFENNVRDLDFISDIYQKNPAPFYSHEVGYTLPFDLFSAIFYLISRYEEYLPHTPDVHGRYPHEASWAYEHKVLHLPMVNIWIQALKAEIFNSAPDSIFNEKGYKHISTIDIDQVFQTKHKSPVKQWGNVLKAIVRLDFKDSTQRICTIFGCKKDAYDVYEHFLALHQKYNVEAYWFFLLANKPTIFDRNLSATHPEFIKLIHKIAQNDTVGIHPSYFSEAENNIATEIKSLSEILKLPITHSRQHYLRMAMPHTYKALVAHGISHDYTMGYAGHEGYRAGTGHSFYWFDLGNNTTTTLRITPFVAMDATLHGYRKFTAKEALGICLNLKADAQKHHTPFCTLWHNESMSGTYPWAGWSEVYENILRLG